MNCHFCQERLEDFLDQRLDSQTLEAFRAHCDGCPQCRAMIEDASFSATITRTVFPSAELTPSPHFYSRLWQAIESENAQPFSWVAVRGLALRFVLAVGLIVVLLVSFDLVTAKRLDQTQMAIETYMEAPGAPEPFRDVMIGDLRTNRDQLLQNLLLRDRQQNSTVLPVHQATPNQAPQK